MKTQYYTAATLDGFIADEHHSLDWLFQFGGPGDDSQALAAGVGAYAIGAHTYEWALENHVYAKPDEPAPWPHAQPTWVFTTRELRPVPNADIRFVRGDVRPVHRAMVQAAKGKNVWVMGGGDLVGQFHDAGLLDEIIITIAPVTLGRGAPLLPRRIVTPPLRLLGVRQMGEAMVQLRYEVRKAER